MEPQEVESQKPQTVWVQLYVRQEKRGGAFKIKPIPEDINDLKEAVKEKWGDSLPCRSPELAVYASGTAMGTIALNSWDPVPTGSEGQTPLIVVAPQHYSEQQPQIVTTRGDGPLSHALLRDVWFSVLRVVNDATDEKATGLVFDIHKDDGGPFLLLILPKHFHFKKDELVNAFYCDEDGEFFLAVHFTKNAIEIYHDGGTHDLMIYKIRLDEKEWRTEDPGKAYRFLQSTTKRMRAHKSRGAAPKPAKRIDFICKTPRISYEVTRSMPVNIFGFPGTYNSRWEASSFVTTVNRDFFTLQNLSAPGLSGGAVIASHLGEIVGFVAGAYDSEEKGKVQHSFESYAILARSLPKRPSSNLSSPNRDPLKAAMPNAGNG